MKRMWIGGWILAIVLAAGLLTGTAMEKWLTPGAEQLRRAAEAALAEDWDTALTLTEEVRWNWGRLNSAAQMLSTHEELDQIEIFFAQLPAYARRDSCAYSAACTALAQQLEALAKAHGCSWGNLL